MAKKEKETTPLPPPVNAFRDTTSRHAVNELIRSHGFRINSRPKKGQPLWEKNDKVLTEKQVLKLLKEQDVADALYAEELYREGL